LVENGIEVAVYNRSPAAAAALRERGARVAKSPRDAADGAQFVLSMVAHDDASRGIWLGDAGALAGTMRGAILIESSTISPAWVRQLSAAAAERGCELLDAPVTGSKPQAAAGQLVFLVGGSATALERARPVLSAMSREIIHLGPTGSGALVKLINNFVCGVQAVAVAEALALIERTGLDAAKALAVLTEGAPGSPLVKTLAKRMTTGDFTPNFRLKLMAKDLKYAIDEASGHSLPLSTAAAALSTMQKAADAGLAEKDLSSVIEFLRK
jgi:3-hydroxyisobutyrate dehydrogenase